MSKRILVLRKELQNLKKQNGARYEDCIIELDFKRSREDTERLTGFPLFLSSIHEIASDTRDWEWTEDQIQRACDKSGMNRGSIFTDSHKAPRNITFKIRGGII